MTWRQRLLSLLGFHYIIHKGWTETSNPLRVSRVTKLAGLYVITKGSDIYPLRKATMAASLLDLVVGQVPSLENYHAYNRKTWVPLTPYLRAYYHMLPEESE